MSTFSLTAWLDAPASPRFGTGIAIGGALIAATWIGLIAQDQSRFYDQKCGSVAAIAADRYAECISRTFAGSKETPQADLAAAIAHLQSKSFDAEGPVDGAQTIMAHSGSVLAYGTPTARISLDVENGTLRARALEPTG